MPIRRRTLLAAAPVGLLMPSLIRPALAQRADARMDTRSVGRADAKLVVQEWFSLTCTHCAHFSQTAFPEVKEKLIDTGRVLYVFRDFPLDQTALLAAAVARSLPPDRYLPFVEQLFATQDKWAFVEDPFAALGRQAVLAGMSYPDFKALSQDHLRDEILAEQDAGQKQYTIEGTPTFIFGATKAGPVTTYAEFAAAVDAALAHA
ncbi:thioredoxin domain-containing protein [Lichenicola sp.]|uniref:thioredoxin domain-containing protein n=1 Tax=Lichenicola sp. TaxID=2804529 RepID=UPI003B00F940